MAYWKRYPHGVVVWNCKGRKLRRADVKHLDNEPDHNVETWVHNWALTHEDAAPAHSVLTDVAVRDLVERFCTYLETRRKSPKTITQHRHNLTRFCLPFLVQVEGLVDPILWPNKSVRLLDHLLNRGVGTRTITTANVSMRVFWDWLVEEGIAKGSLLLRNPVRDEARTPLSFAVTPAEVLEYAGSLQLMAQIGYFFSLRPQELVALRPIDFLAGPRAAELECCKVMAGAGLFSKLAVKVHRQRIGNDFRTPKVGSQGWVACFDETAARAIVEELKKRKPEELLFGWRLDYWYTLWRKHGIADLTLKDLRRSSLYWLGHHTALPFTALKNHARHKDPNTTAIYTRRPDETAIGEWDLDLDA